MTQERGQQQSPPSVLAPPLNTLCLIGSVKGVSSVPSHCGGLNFTQRTHSSIAISLNLKIPSSSQAVVVDSGGRGRLTSEFKVKLIYKVNSMLVRAI